MGMTPRLQQGKLHPGYKRHITPDLQLLYHGTGWIYSYYSLGRKGRKRETNTSTISCLYNRQENMTFRASTVFYQYKTNILNINPWQSAMSDGDHTHPSSGNLNLWLSKIVTGATAFTDTGKRLLTGEWKDVLKTTVGLSAAGSANQTGNRSQEEEIWS